VEWSTFWTALFTSILGTGAIGALFVFLAKKWLGTRIEQSFKHEYDKKLEEHKAHLRKQTGLSLQHKQAQFQEGVQQNAVDKELFAKLLQTLPSSGSIEFLKMHDVGGNFEWSRLDELHAFRHDWDSPEHHFLDQDLDSRRAQLCDAVGSYLDFLALNTFATDAEHDRHRVPPEWSWKQPQKYEDTIGALNSLVDKVVRAHGDLVMFARKRLKC
jgi:hypothetical protein